MSARLRNYFTQLILVLTPGVAVSGGAYILAKRRDSAKPSRSFQKPCNKVQYYMPSLMSFRHSGPPKPMWVISAALLAMLALSAPLVGFSHHSFSVPGSAPDLPGRCCRAAPTRRWEERNLGVWEHLRRFWGEVVEEIQLRSGEERLMPNGQVQLVSDPRQVHASMRVWPGGTKKSGAGRPGNGPAEEGWQQALWTEMAQADLGPTSRGIR